LDHRRDRPDEANSDYDGDSSEGSHVHPRAFAGLGSWQPSRTLSRCLPVRQVTTRWEYLPTSRSGTRSLARGCVGLSRFAASSRLSWRGQAVLGAGLNCSESRCCGALADSGRWRLRVKPGHGGHVCYMTALPPKADVRPRSCYVADVPQPVVSSCGKAVVIRSPCRRVRAAQAARQDREP
jgi:hypothetical protein